MKNYSKQREAVLKTVRSVTSHPTAAEVYEAVRRELPNISLGTVYRNLSVLCEAGDLLCLHMGDGVERYDGNCNTHLHLHCRVCGGITDVEMPDGSVRQAAEEQEFSPEIILLSASGVCNSCR